MTTVTTLIEQTAAANSAEREKASAKYRELLGRNAKPRPGDAAELKAVMGTLGKVDADLAADLAVLAHAAELADRVAQFPAAEAARVEADLKTLAVMTESRRILRERYDADLAAGAVSLSITNRVNRLCDDRQRLAQLRHGRQDLFGGDE